MDFSELKNSHLYSLDALLNRDSYFAHLPVTNEAGKETLKEHLKLVEEYFYNIVYFNNLESIINKLISGFLKDFNSPGLFSFVKELFYQAIIYHDYGKINYNFQSEKMKNSDISIPQIEHSEGSHHSAISAYIFIVHLLKLSEQNNLNENEQVIADFLTICFAFPIFKHHSSCIDKIVSNKSFDIENLNQIKGFLKEFSFLIEENELEFFHELVSDIELNFKRIKELRYSFGFFPLFALLKLNYSLLTASDYLATSDYMNGLKYNTEDKLGLITERLRKKLIENFDANKKTPYNGDLIRNKGKYISLSIRNLLEKNNTNLNLLRMKMGAEVISNIEKYSDKRVFYIEAPTGGGKTNMSMIAIRKLLEIAPEINKVFYVFPFTSLITQTYKAIKDTFGLSNNDITQIHSKAGFQEKEYELETDAKYGTDLKNQVDNLFVNYPFILLTHIKFFDILKSNKKDSNYLLHRLANSVVVIDELQSYNPEHWDKVKYFVAQYAELFNIRFILMSATLPKIDEIKLSTFKPTRFIPLLNDAKKYLQNPNFSERVAIKTELLLIKIELEKLAELVFQKSYNYAMNRTDKYHNSVYSIIEFIFKKTASEFFDITDNKNKKENFFDEIFVLSGTIIEPRRKYIIEFLKDNNNKDKRILLITTQVVEAGVDIDMDIGFKNQSLIDSDEQLAGRINRNVYKSNCELWLFKHDKPKSIYGKDLRYEVTNSFTVEFIEEILLKKDFSKLYEKVFSEIEKLNKSVYKTNLINYLDNFESLNFKEIQQQFKLIEQENASIFVPVDINIHCYGNENNFSDAEIKFLTDHNCLCELDKKKVSGENVWNIYEDLIRNKENNFLKKNLELKKLNSIMSRFVFSIVMRKIELLIPFLDYDEKSHEYSRFQYYKFSKENLDKVYTIEGGINEKFLEQKFKQTFEFI